MSQALSVTDAEALDDQVWFSVHRQRRYRARRGAPGLSKDGGWWIVRRRNGAVILRTWTPVIANGVVDTDNSLSEAWFAAAWPGLSPKERNGAVREARRNA